jgi:heme-degrading monooxygenase HmoA
MAFVSVTRLRLRSLRFLPAFLWYAVRSQSQAKQAPGNFESRTQAKSGLAFWTLTVWENESAMRQYILAGTHREAMTKLTHWCDEAALTHWMQDSAETPDWSIAEQKLIEQAKFTPLKYPSQAHREKRF